MINKQQKLETKKSSYDSSVIGGFDFKKLNLVPVEKSKMDQFYMPECNLEVMLPIVDQDTSIAADSNYSLHCLDCFNAAVTYHYGPYETIIHSHLRMMRWLEMNNYEVSAPTMEEYLISPFDLKVDSNYLTKLIYPIRVKVRAAE